MKDSSIMTYYMLSNSLFLKPDIETMRQYKANSKLFMIKYNEIKANHIRITKAIF